MAKRGSRSYGIICVVVKVISLQNKPALLPIALEPFSSFLREVALLLRISERDRRSRQNIRGEGGLVHLSPIYDTRRRDGEAGSTRELAKAEDRKEKGVHLRVEQ